MASLPDFSYLDTTVIVAQSLVFAIGILGNAFVILVVVCHSHMRTVSNILFVSLSLADVAYLFTLPFKTHTTVSETWKFGSFFCKFMLVMSEMNKFTSIFSMVALSVDRFIAISYPTKYLKYQKRTKAIVTCVVIWISSLLIATPFWIFGRVTVYSSKSNCGVSWPLESRLKYFRFWTWFQFTLGFLLPFLVIAIFYICMLRHMMSSIEPLERVSGGRPSANRVAILVLVVTVVFVVCWVPYQVVEFMSLYKQEEFAKAFAEGRRPRMPEVSEIVNFINLSTAARILSAFSSCVNPFIYGLGSRNYRTLFKAVFTKCHIKPVQVDSHEGAPAHLQQTASSSGSPDNASGAAHKTPPRQENFDLEDP